MERIVLGTKEENIEYVFRETCFGIAYKDNEFYTTIKDNEISLIGGGVEEGETHLETLKREFIEEAGLTILDCSEFITIDCFWTTRNKVNMESLANFYIVKVSDEIVEPTEKESKLVRISKKELISSLLLPYQIEAMNLFFKSKTN